MVTGPRSRDGLGMKQTRFAGAEFARKKKRTR
jgi:hypothetical protein